MHKRATILLLMLSLSCFAQTNKNISALLSELEASKTDTATIDALINLAKAYKMKDTIEAQDYLTQAKTIAMRSRNNAGLGKYYEALGEMRLYYGMYENALELFDNSISYYLLSGDEVRRADVIVDQGNAYLFMAEYEKALEYYKSSLSVFERHNAIPGMSRCLNNMGIIHKNFGEYDEALMCYNKTKELYLASNDSISFSEANINLGNVYTLQGAYHQALEHYNSALQIAETAGNKRLMATSMLNIGVVHNKMSNYSTAFDYYLKCLRISKEIDNKVEQSKCLTNIGTNFISMGNYDAAEEYLERSMILKQELGEIRSISNCYNYMADIQFFRNNFEAAIELDFQSIELKSNLNDYEGFARVYNSLSRSYLALNKPLLALKYADSALNYANEIGALEHVANGYEHKKDALGQLGRYKLAYEAANLYRIYADSLFNDHKARAVNELEHKYQSKVLEEENELLKIQTEFDAVLIKRQKKFFYSMLSAMLLFAFSLILLMIINRKSRDYNKSLQKKNQIITKQNLKLDTYNRTKDTIFSVMTHDLRGTIGNQLTALSILGKEEFQSEEERKIVFSRLANSARLSLGLLENLTLWTKIQEKSFNYDPEQGYLNHTFKEVISLYNESFNNKELHFEARLDHDVPCFFDTDMIVSVLKNLLSNAIKFTNRGGKIDVGIDVLVSGVRLYICDDGIGLKDAEIQELIKGKVSKMRRGTENEKGSGLGLNIVKTFLDFHTSKLHIESSSEKGTTVSFILQKSRPEL